MAFAMFDHAIKKLRALREMLSFLTPLNALMVPKRRTSH